MRTKTEKESGSSIQRTGTVVSRSGDKSIVVRVERRKRHPLYGKVVSLASKIHAHDEANRARLGDKVTICECRPMSRTKRWRLIGVESPRQTEKVQES